MIITAASYRPRVLLAVLAALVAALVLSGAGLRPPHARAAQVVMVDVTGFAFVPGTITIQVGDTVQWTNADPVDHTATSTSGPASFDVYLSAGAWGSHTFDVAGTYDYYCIPHPTMVGRIVVEPAPAAPAPSGGGSVPDVAISAPGDPLPSGLAVLALVGLLGLAALDVRRRRRFMLVDDNRG